MVLHCIDETKPLDPPEGLILASPANHKLFTRDIIELSADVLPKVVYSPVRIQTYIAGVLLLENNKTFGRNETKKRLLYKCIPDDKHLPSFLIPFEIKLGFSKQIKINMWFSNMIIGKINIHMEYYKKY